ncbi:MAG: carboxypeptidase-like regulatory domain-containing protein, partial [Candidatus Micrarchaeota archaeon]
MAQERSGFYTSIEDSYYGFCDYLQQNLKIPIYDSFVTPIESRGVPSFPAFIGILLIIAIAAIFIFSNQATATTTLKVSVAQLGIPLDEALVSLQIDGKEFKALKTNSEGIVQFANVPVGKSATLNIEKEGFVSDEKTITISKEQEDLEISLQTKSVKEEKISITLKVKDLDGIPLDSVLISYFDSETGNFETTSSDASGSAVLFAQNSKSELSLTVSKNNYVEEQVSIFAENERTKIVTLRKKAVVPIIDGGELTGTGEVLVYVVDSKGMPVDANVHLHLFSTNAEIGFERTFDSGKTAFENVDAVGAKIYVIVEPRNSELLQTYDGSADAQILTSKDPAEFNVVLEKTSSRDKNITLLVSDKAGAAIAQVTIKVYNQDTGIPLATKTTNADGKVAFSTDKLVYATFSKEGYLPTYELDLIAGDDKSIILQKISEDSVGSVNVKVIDFDGELVQGAKVNLMTQEGYFTGIREAISMEDGIAKFENVPIELLGDEAKYIAKGNFESVSGSSSMFLPQVNEVIEIPLKLSQAKGNAIISLKDATNGKPINSGKASAYLRQDDSKISDCSDFSSGTCTIEIPANKLAYFKITSQNFVDLESEDFFVDPLEKKNFEGALIPSALKDELAVYFDGVSALDGNGVFSRNSNTLTKGNYYNAKFVLNIPSNSEKAGIFIKASSRDSVEAEADIAYINSYSKPENAIITKGFAYRPSDNCKLDSGVNEEADGKPAKWLNYEYRKQQSSKAIIVKVFVKPTAKTTDEIAFDYRGYSAIGKVFARTPEDGAFGINERT